MVAAASRTNEEVSETQATAKVMHLEMLASDRFGMLTR